MKTIARMMKAVLWWEIDKHKTGYDNLATLKQPEVATDGDDDARRNYYFINFAVTCNYSLTVLNCYF